MKKTEKMLPEFMFESGWEVCNKVGGIYTVISTKVKTMQKFFGKNLIFIGPDLWKDRENPDFIEQELIPGWKSEAAGEGLRVRTGRWNVPGMPITVLTDFLPVFEEKNDVYRRMWERFGVDSLHANGDYDDCCMFAVSAGKTVESLCRFLKLDTKRVAAQFHEWSLGMAVLYIKEKLPDIRTVFTTHATTVGRSICFNSKPLYGQFGNYDGDQMSRELNVEAKHSLEKQAANHAGRFTTVSLLTARECEQILGKYPAVTPNGFESELVPDRKTLAARRIKVRKLITEAVERMSGEKFSGKPFIVAISGRNEYRNKGVDLFLEAVRLVRQANPEREIIFLVLVPGISIPNQLSGAVKTVAVSSYLDGSDGMFNLQYYDMLSGLDLTVFPSYYEPWGYTPHESISFGVPTVTTNLAGFGLWALENGIAGNDLTEGIAVLNRDDDNFVAVAEKIRDIILSASTFNDRQAAKASSCARRLSRKAGWDRFIHYYLNEYMMEEKTV
ncbi:MAG: glycosyltransferase [Dysgonamonadaceae bacterium]|jgi:glycosyltransferase involved in cell wall biosynthesis|nr:glycosyltransferase [Dysgonamonadaceae bacterium]